MDVRKVRRLILCGLLPLTLGFTAVEASTTVGASTVSPSWRLAASYSPMANVRSVSCAPSTTSAATFCLAVGDDGHNHPSIMATDDGGVTWSNQPVAKGLVGLATVVCPLVSVCYASGSSGIMHSSNGGVTWSTQDPSFEAADMFCVTPAQCYAVGQLGMIATSDGSTWTSVALPEQVTDLNAITCPSILNCYALGAINGTPSVIGEYKSGPWELLGSINVASLSAIGCTSGSTCVVVGADQSGGSTAFVTSDSGVNWNPSSYVPQGGSLEAVDCQTSTACIAVGTNGDSTPYVISSTNAGSSWSTQTAPPGSDNLESISCSNSLDCVAVGDTGNLGAGSTIMETTNAGTSWDTEAPPQGTDQVNSVACPSLNKCFAVGIDALLASSNQGYSWTPLTLPLQVDGLMGISCPSVMDCTAVGFGSFESPIILSTTDGGQAWHTAKRASRCRVSHWYILCEHNNLSGC